MDTSSELSSILLKLRFLASRLGSVELEEWVRHESEGYPPDGPVPAYRVLSVSYTGNWSGPFGSGIRNAPIPDYLIEKLANKSWTHYEMRSSISVVDDLLTRDDGEGGTYEIDAANLILLLQGKVYEKYACNSVTGHVPKAAIRSIQYAVRSRILELTIALEKAVPAAVDVVLGEAPKADTGTSDAVAQIVNKTIYGNYTEVVNSGAGARITLNIGERDVRSLISELVKAGIPERSAEEFAGLVASEEPTSREQPFGRRACEWLGRNVVKAADGTWKIGVGVATAVLEEAALRYYGLK